MIGVIRPEAMNALPTSRRKASGSFESLVGARGEGTLPMTFATGAAAWGASEHGALRRPVEPRVGLVPDDVVVDPPHADRLRDFRRPRAERCRIVFRGLRRV